MQKVRKRNGKTVDYEPQKISECIKKANRDSKDVRMNNTEIGNIVSQVEKELEDTKIPSVEHIQDVVENVLMKTDHVHTAKSYIVYRAEHAKIRDTHEDLMKQMMEVTFKSGEDSDYKRSNANIQSDSVMGTMLIYGTTVSNYFSDNYVIPKKFIDAHRAGLIHIHDKDFSNITFNCLQMDLEKLFKGGFSTGHGHLREPNSIRSYAALACIAIQSSQNDQFGGQSIAQFDRAMSDGVRKTFKKELFSAVRELLMFAHCNEDSQQNFINAMKELNLVSYKNTENMTGLIGSLSKCFEHVIEEDFIKDIITSAYKIACKRTEKETAQAMEAVIHNFNTLHSRSGAQVPFSSLNFGTDTTEEGRLVTEKLLLAQEAGLGNGETSIFPITIFRLKEGINYNPEDKNYDLFKLACRVSAKRLYPNFESQDATFNLKYYDPNDYRTEIATMGCRTRTVSNVNGPNIVTSRGNFSFTTINLPKIAIESNRDVKKFFKSLDKTMKLCKEQLLWRLDLVGKRHAYNFPFLMGQHLWLDSEKLKPTDEIREVLKHASISIGFCGLAEALVSLIGHHHGENEEAQKLGLKIIGHMREVCDKFADETHLNFTLFGSPKHKWALVA